MTISSDKRKLFIEAYLDCLNATEAARRAGYAKPGQEGHRLLKNAEIRALVQEGMKVRAMPADEVLARLSAIASADIRELFDFDDAGNMKKFKLTRDAPLHLIKSITPTAKGLKVELHDAKAALDTLAKHHGLLVDRQESGPPGTFAPVREVVIEVPADESVDTNE